jgi:predicted nucleic acid-binding protein
VSLKPTLYLETTIPSYLTAWPTRDLIVAGHQQITKEWWVTRREGFEIRVSQFVLDEAGRGDPAMARERLEALQPFPLLDITNEVVELSDALLASHAIPAKAAADAAHVAVCAVHGIEYLMTWNCAHLANGLIVRSLRRVCEAHGFECPEIRTPEELMENEI